MDNNDIMYLHFLDFEGVFPSEHPILKLIREPVLDEAGYSFIKGLSINIHCLKEKTNKSEYYQILDYLACRDNCNINEFCHRYTEVIILNEILSLLGDSFYEIEWKIDRKLNGIILLMLYPEKELGFKGIKFSCTHNTNQIIHDGNEMQFIRPFFWIDYNSFFSLASIMEDCDVKTIKPCVDYLHGVLCQPNSEDVMNVPVIISETNEEYEEIIGLLNSKYGGAFVSETDLEKGFIKHTAGALVVLENEQLIFAEKILDYECISGDSKQNSVCFLFNHFQSYVSCDSVKKALFPIIVHEEPINNPYYCFIKDEKKRVDVQNIINLFVQSLGEQSQVSNDILFYSTIYCNFMHYPELLSAFSIKPENAINEMCNMMQTHWDYIEKNYPIGNTIRDKRSYSGGVGFSLMYSGYILSNQFGCDEFIQDFVSKKLVAKNKNGLFDDKVFNESYAEVQVFLYLFSSIFFRSELGQKVVSFEYEPDGANNKRFEYAFVFPDYKINVEVKALMCDPEKNDSIRCVDIKNESKYYKKYFFSSEESAMVPEYVSNGRIELKSNYRQLQKNIKNIIKKCDGKDRDINLGFIIITWGTSIEEYVSYMLHPEFGYLAKHNYDLGYLDAVIIFSMRWDSDLFMDKLFSNNHVIVFPNDMRDNRSLLQQLRLNNIVKENNTLNVYSKEIYGVYSGINRKGLVSIQREDNITEESLRELDYNLECIYKRNLYNKMLGLT